jgi:hypothetical protein
LVPEGGSTWKGTPGTVHHCGVQQHTRQKHSKRELWQSASYTNGCKTQTVLS